MIWKATKTRHVSGLENWLKSWQFKSKCCFCLKSLKLGLRYLKQCMTQGKVVYCLNWWCSSRNKMSPLNEVLIKFASNQVILKQFFTNIDKWLRVRFPGVSFRHEMVHQWEETEPTGTMSTSIDTERRRWDVTRNLLFLLLHHFLLTGHKSDLISARLSKAETRNWRISRSTGTRSNVRAALSVECNEFIITMWIIETR